MHTRSRRQQPQLGCRLHTGVHRKGFGLLRIPLQPSNEPTFVSSWRYFNAFVTRRPLQMLTGQLTQWTAVAVNRNLQRGNIFFRSRKLREGGVGRLHSSLLGAGCDPRSRKMIPPASMSEMDIKRYPARELPVSACSRPTIQVPANPPRAPQLFTSAITAPATFFGRISG